MTILINEQVLNEAVSLDKIIKAIQNKYVLEIEYENTTGKRYIEPVLLGHTVAGNQAIRAYQFKGVTTTEEPDWKIFRIDGIKSLKYQKRLFLFKKGFKLNRPNYNPDGDKMFSSIEYMATEK